MKTILATLIIVICATVSFCYHRACELKSQLISEGFEQVVNENKDGTKTVLWQKPNRVMKLEVPPGMAEMLKGVELEKKVGEGGAD